MTIDLSQFAQLFFEEVAEHLENMEQLLLSLDPEEPDPEDLNAIFRAAHSIKGGAGTFGFTDMASFTHVMESVLDKVRNGALPITQELIDVCLESGDVLHDQLAGHRDGAKVHPHAADGLVARLQKIAGDHGAVTHAAHVATITAPSPATSEASEGGAADGESYRLRFTPESAFDAESSAAVLAELAALGTVELVSAPDAAVWEVVLRTKRPEEIKDVFSWLGDASRLELKPLDQSGEPAYGFFEPLPGNDSVSADEDPGYGFFEPLPESSAGIAATEDPGYGFFEPLPEPVAPLKSGDDPGYGFFDPLPEPAATVATDVGDHVGYGFFEPLPEPVRKPEALPVAEVVASAQAPVLIATPVSAPHEPEVSEVLPERRKGERVGGRRETDKAADTSIRVGVEKVDQLINLVGELVITHAMLAQSIGRTDPVLYQDLHNGLAQLERNSRDLQESVMSIRMLPMNVVFSRFPRVVRDLANKLGKQVELRLQGESTELDKSLTERITDPLTHLVRNSLDHGIENPEDRLAAGKLPQGTILLSASHQGGHIVIEVSDDGRGLNRQKLISKAREKGIPASDEMSDHDVWQLIFAPGFSTAETVTDVSGRGVGMDVVKRNIQAIGGRVELSTSPGYGTRTTIHLPLTLAILDGMSIAVGDNMFIIPLTNIVESLQPRAENIKAISGRGYVIQVRDEYLPLISLYEVFHLTPKFTDPSTGIVVVVGAGSEKMALFVDELLGQHQVVIKSLETNYRKVKGISGATIMGDGRVALILDVPALVGIVQHGAGASQMAIHENA